MPPLSRRTWAAISLSLGDESMGSEKAEDIRRRLASPAVTDGVGVAVAVDVGVFVGQAVPMHTESEGNAEWPPLSLLNPPVTV